MPPRAGKTGGPLGVQRATNSIDRAIAKHIRIYRVQVGLDAEACADKIGVSADEYQSYERGTARIPASQLVLLAALLNVPVAALLRPASAKADGGSSGIVVTMPRREIRQDPSLEDRLLSSFRAIKHRKDKQMVADLAARLAETCCSATRG